MKKKLLSMLLLSALVLSMAACGNSNEKNYDEDDKEIVEDEGEKEETKKPEKTEEVEEAGETTTAPETTEETTTEAPPKELPKIKECSTLVMMGCITFEADGKSYALNLVDRKLYEYDRKEHRVSAAAHNIALISGDKIYNFATGEEYEGECLSNSSYLSHFNPVHKVEESFDGNVNYFGVIDWNGDWVLPLSSEYEICKYDIKESTFYCSDSMFWDYYTTGLAFEFMSNRTFSPKDYGYNSIAGIGGENALLFKYGEGKYFTGLARYNTKSGEITVILENAEYNEYPFDMQSWYAHGMAYVNKDGGGAILLDNDFNVVNFDLSEYKIRQIYDLTEDYAVFASESSDGIVYTVILDKNGKRIIEPMKGKSQASIIGDYVIICGKKTDYVINCKTGETKTYEDNKVYDIVSYDIESGLMLVKADDAYYLADPSDPDTLINPFEYAAN